MHEVLITILILLAASLFAVALFKEMGLPSLMGYLLVGVAIGPHALGLMPQDGPTAWLAEFGVVFLMFSIGLEFSLTRLNAMRRIVLGLGALQVIVTHIVLTALFWLLGLSLLPAWALAGALTMSSTAILSKLLVERRELEKPHGRETIGVLLFQDLAVVPLLILVPAFASSQGDQWVGALALAMSKTVAALVLVLRYGHPLMSRWFDWVAKRRSPELFMINVLLVTLGMAALSEAFGLSLALGAFLAGMLISETAYRYQVEEDIKPFRDVLLGLFFITVGMFLDIGEVTRHFIYVAGLLVLVLAIKFTVVFVGSRMMGSNAPVAMRSALWLCTGGEFGFVLLAQSAGLEILPSFWLQTGAAALVLSMLLAPLIVAASDRLVLRFVASEWMTRAMELTAIAAQTIKVKQHVLVLGYGRTGQYLARLLEHESVPTVALDLDPERVAEATAAGENVLYGDASRRETLIAAGLLRARAVVISFADLQASLRVLSVLRELRPDVPVVVRARAESDIDWLTAAGATAVISEAIEVSLMLATHTLALIGTPLSRVARRIREIRAQRYALLRGYFAGSSDERGSEGLEGEIRLHSVLLPEEAWAVGRHLGELGLKECGVEVAAVRRRGIRAQSPEPGLILRPGDVVILRGEQKALERGEAILLQGP